MPAHRLEVVAQLIRAPLLAVTFVFVLLGVAASTGSATPGRLALTLLAALWFHLAVYVANDIVDLPIDRTEPRRAASPLVRGAVSPRHMAVLAGVAALAGVGFAAALSPEAGAAMAVATVALLVYDLWGKRWPFPPATDLVQGVGWAALLVAGSLAAGSATPATGWLAAYVVVAILLVNGIHGGVRDLANDQRHGARTTTRLLGGRVDDAGRFHLPPRLWAYATALHVADVALLAVPLATGAGTRWVALVVVAAGGTACLVVLGHGLRHAGNRPTALRDGFVYIVTMQLLPLCLVADRLDGPLVAVLAALFAGPWAGSTYVRSALGRRAGDEPRSGDGHRDGDEPRASDEPRSGGGHRVEPGLAARRHPGAGP